MKAFTERQRQILKHRLARAIAWDKLATYERDNANRTAECVLDELEQSFLGAAAQRRGVLAIVERLEQTA